MTVKELKELLAEAPDDMVVMVAVEDHLQPGLFAFAEACTCETGVTDLDATEDGLILSKAFLILPHGFGVSESDPQSGDEIIPELN